MFLTLEVCNLALRASLHPKHFSIPSQFQIPRNDPVYVCLLQLTRTLFNVNPRPVLVAHHCPTLISVVEPMTCYTRQLHRPRDVVHDSDRVHHYRRGYAS